MKEHMKVVEKWAVSENITSFGEVLTGPFNLTIKDIGLHNCIESIDQKGDKQFAFRVFQIQYAEEILDGLYLTFEEAKQEIYKIAKEAMTVEELFDSLEEMGYDIRFDNGSINPMVAGEMAANEGIRYDDKLDRWFK